MEAWPKAVVAPTGAWLGGVRPARVRLVAAAGLGGGAGGGEEPAGGAGDVRRGGGAGGGRSSRRDGSTGDRGSWGVSASPGCCAVLLLVSEPLEVTVTGNLLGHGHVGGLPVGGLQLVLDHHLLGQVVVRPLESLSGNRQEVRKRGLRYQVTSRFT